MARIDARVPDEIEEFIEQKSRGAAFDDRTEVINYYLKEAYDRERESKEKKDSEAERDEPELGALQATNSLINGIISTKYSEFVQINNRAVQLLEFNGLIPVAFLAVISNAPGSYELGWFFMIGAGFFLLSALSAVATYLISRPPKRALNEESFDTYVVNQGMSEAEFLWWILKKEHYETLDNLIQNNQFSTKILIISVLLFICGVVFLGAEAVISL